MSDTQLASLRRSYETFDIDELDGWLQQCIHPEVEWQAARDDPDAALHRGHEGVRRYVTQWTEAFADLRVQPLEMIAGPERIFVWVRITGRSRTTGLPLEMEQAQVTTLDDGKTRRVDEYFDRDEGLAAAGLAG